MKIAVIGNGMIAHDGLQTIQNVPNIECVAICSREKSISKAKVLAEKFNIDKVYTDYDQVLLDENIDFIYIAVSNNVHFDYVKKALSANKHVICEKPFTSLARETEELKNLAIEKNLFLFEAITVMYSPNFQYVKDNLHRIGKIKIVQANFSKISSRYPQYLQGETEPVFRLESCGGTLYDLNIYNLHFVIGLFGKPLVTQYLANIGHSGVDTSGIVSLSYEDFHGVCIAAKDSTSDSFISIQGEKGYIHLNSGTNTCRNGKICIGNDIEYFDYEKYDARMMNEWIAFENIFSSDDKTTCYSLLEHSVKVMETLEEARKSANIVFPND